MSKGDVGVKSKSLCAEVTKWNIAGTKPLATCRRLATCFGDFNNFCTYHARARGIPRPETKLCDTMKKRSLTNTESVGTTAWLDALVAELNRRKEMRSKAQDRIVGGVSKTADLYYARGFVDALEWVMERQNPAKKNSNEGT